MTSTKLLLAFPFACLACGDPNVMPKVASSLDAVKMAYTIVCAGDVELPSAARACSDAHAAVDAAIAAYNAVNNDLAAESK